MTWFMVSDDVGDHPKFDALRDGPCFGEAVALWTLAGSWLRKQLIDGDVPRGRIRLFGLAKPEKAAAELVRVGLWSETSDGFRFHNWLAYNPSRDEEMEKRAKTGNRQAKYRMMMRDKAKSNGVTNADPVRHVTPSESVTNAHLSSPLPAKPDDHHSVVVSGRAREPGPTQNTRPKPDRFCSALYASWKRSFGRVPGAGHPDRLDESWCVLGAGLTRLEATTLERCQAVASVMTVEQLDEAVQNFAADSFATKRGHPFELFAAQASRYVGKRPRHPSAVSDFSDAPENPEF